MAVLNIASKSLGYIRTLIIAWAFGTSPGMDSYHLALGIMALLTGVPGSAVENAALPEITKEKVKRGNDDSSKTIIAFITSIVFAITVLFTAAILIAPGVTVKFFASGFDPERIRTGARMMYWLLPFAVVSMLKPVLEVWANLTERYTLASLTTLPFNLITIPVLLLSMKYIGVYSVAFSMSAGYIMLFVIFLAALGGIPLKWSARHIAWDVVARIFKNSLYVVILFAANTIYVVVDRYFASGLPFGSVAAISYAAAAIGILYAIAGTPMTYFLSIIAKLGDNSDEALRILKNAVLLSLAYLIPVCGFLMAVSYSAISLVFGWGNFGARSVSMTSASFAAYCVGFAFSISSVLIYRYALALGKLKTIVRITFVLIAQNTLLDWALAPSFGLFGLSMATSVTQITGFVIYYYVMAGSNLPGFLYTSRLIGQTVLSASMAYAVYLISAFGAIIQLVSCAFLCAAYFVIAEKSGLMAGIPQNWRPSGLISFLLFAAKSYARTR